MVDIHVDEIMIDLGVWQAYDQADRELRQRAISLDGPPTGAAGTDREADAPNEEELDRRYEQIAILEGRLEQQREQDWADYGQALKAHVEAAGRRLPGLRVPVHVVVDLNAISGDGEAPDRGSVAVRLLDQAIEASGSGY